MSDVFVIAQSAAAELPNSFPWVCAKKEPRGKGLPKLLSTRPSPALVGLFGLGDLEIGMTGDSIVSRQDPP